MKLKCASNYLKILLLGIFLIINFNLNSVSTVRLSHGKQIGLKYGKTWFHNAESQFPEQWFEGQLLDHFDPNNNATWRQRYYVNMEHFDSENPQAPVFLMLEGETVASPGWLDESQMADNAKHYKAALVNLEHRYYGKSHPTSDMSTKNLKYLSSEQALADGDSFIKYFKSQHNLTDSNKVIVFGGSYSGNLAAWFRLKYPNLVLGAISSSAPVLAKLNFDTFFRVVDHVFGLDFMGKVHEGIEQLVSLLKSSTGREEIAKKFNLCPPSKTIKTNSNIPKTIEELYPPLSPLDVSNLVEAIADKIADIEIGSGSNNSTLSESKRIMFNNATYPEAIDRLAEVVNLKLFNCLSYDYDDFIRQYSEDQWTTEITEDRLWTYQTCTEFGYFQTSTYPQDGKPYGDYFSDDFFIQQCKDIFGPSFDREEIQKGIDKTNAIYGGLSLSNYSNVVFVNGLMDPWHELGVLKENPSKPSVFSLVIPGSSHCGDMGSNSKNDLPQVINARKKITKYIGQFLNSTY